MTSSDSSRTSRACLIPVALVLAAAAFRWAKLRGLVTVDALENFAPWMALAFTGTLVFPQRMAWASIPLLLLGVDLAATGVSGVLHWEALFVYACFAAAALFAGRLRGRVGLLGAVAGVIGCGVGFYLITNTVSWFADPGYVKNLAGWVQAMTTGLPNFVPTYLFLRNSLVSDLGFSLLLLAAYNTEASVRRQKSIPLLRSAAA
ncbi:MAG: DUF6580 family putative transport protein [Prosthecobacter sp.]